MKNRDGRPGSGLSDEVLEEALALVAEFERRSLEGEATLALLQFSTVH